MLICICMNANWYVLLPLCIWMIMLRNMFLCFKYHASAVYVCMSMFMGLDAGMIWCIVVSSSPVEGSRTLQCGIRALVVAWTWMGHEDAVTELMLQHLGLRGPWETINRGSFSTAQKKPKEMGEDRKIQKISKCQNRRRIEGLSAKFFRRNGRISLLTTRLRTAGRKISQFC